jgi:glycosyltransferase involved in cell wall biosynthesis
MRTVPNGIDLPEAMSLAGSPEGSIVRSRHGLHAGDLLLLSVGRIEDNKGFEDLAAALAEAAKPGGKLAATNWRWVVIGTGPAQQKLEEAINRAGISGRTQLIGRAPDADLHAWYEAASIFVHPTRYEGSSLVTLEAMAHRKPIIATRAGGLPDKVVPGVNGWLVDPGNVRALADAISEATTADLPALGAASRDLVERQFSWTMLVDQQIAIYEELLASSR